MKLFASLAALAFSSGLFGAVASLAQGPAGPAATPAGGAVAAPVQPARVMRGEPYLKDYPPQDSIVLSPAPPAPGSPAEARDLAAAEAALALRGTPRWALAMADADLAEGRPGAAFSCAAGVVISAAATPRLNRLLFRSMADLGMSTSVIKRAYQRPRPFMVNGQPTCTPQWEQVLRRDGSYPSGHSAIGYGLGLILAELIPSRSSQLVARGRAFGDSRRICNVHWLSDTEEGRVAAAATVARLHSEAAFRADMDAARRELARTSAPRDCATEEAALAG